MTGSISESLRQYLSNIPGKHKIKELQKTTILGTAHVLWKVLMLKYKIFHGQNNVICCKNCKQRTVATLYTLETVCFGYTSVNTLHKGVQDDDDDDDDDDNNNNLLC